jgi:hypothetical protein
MEASLRLILLLTIAAIAAAAPPTDARFAQLSLYHGKWQITRANSSAGAKPDVLENQCATLGKYFACQQTINGQQGNLVVFVATNKANHFYSQNITPEGRATGRADLDIAGDKWTYNSTWDDGGKTTYYRTTNLFTGKNKIHFEQAESSNGTDYKVTGSGDEVKLGAGAR